MGSPETQHVIIQSEKGVNQWRHGNYICKCGRRFKTFHQWRDHRSEERRKRFELAQ